MGREAFQYGEGAGVGERAGEEVLCEKRAGKKLQRLLDGMVLVQPHVIWLHARTDWTRSLDCIAGGDLDRRTALHGMTGFPLFGLCHK